MGRLGLQHQRKQLVAEVDAQPVESAVAVGLDRGYAQAQVAGDALFPQNPLTLCLSKGVTARLRLCPSTGSGRADVR